MSRWVDRVRNHAIWGSLDALVPSINAASNREGINADTLDSLARLQTVITYGSQRLSATDPALVLPNVLDNLLKSVTQTKAHIDQFIANGDIAQINAANVQADAFLVNPNLAFGATTPEDVITISQAAGEYRQNLEKHLESAQTVQRALQEKAAANETKITAIEQALKAEQQRLATLFTEHQTQFSTAQDKRASEFAASQADYLAKYTSTATEQQTHFSSDQDARKTAFSTLQLESQEKLSAVINDYDQRLKGHEEFFITCAKKVEADLKANLETLKTDHVNQASLILEKIDQHKKDVENLVGVIGNLGVTSGYKKAADYARWMTLLWQFITVLSLSGLVVVATLVAFPDFFGISHQGNQRAMEIKVDAKPQGESQVAEGNNKEATVGIKVGAEVITPSQSDAQFYQGLATRLFLSITFGIFAAYAGKQASRFFETERRNRKLALELEALGPFIEPLEKSDRDKFRVQIGDRSFGVSDYDLHKPKDDDAAMLVGWAKSKEGIETIANSIKDILKTAKPNS